MKKMLMLMSVFVFGLCANAQITTNSSCDTNLNGTVSIEDVTNVANKVIGAPAKEAEVVTAAQVNATLERVNNLLTTLEKEHKKLQREHKEILDRLKDVETAGLYTSNYADGYQFVDLGLPSGTLWATCNIGADSPEEYGDYYAWGETAPQADNMYSWASYSLCNGTSTTITKYCSNSSYGTVDNLTELEAADDAATVNWGSEWQMPTSDQFKELFNSSYTTKEWTTVNGVNGYKITSKISGYTDRYIFLPAGGVLSNSSLGNGGSNGHYWTRSGYASNPTGAYVCAFQKNSVSNGVTTRTLGRSIRPVRVAKKQAYVDLGLPSGTLWATCNVGANSPEEYGDYFAWGETTPQADNTYTWKSYSLCSGSELSMTKYCTNDTYGTVDKKTELEAADDAATANWGSDWQMPSEDQIDELTNTNYTTTEWTTINGIYGRKITSKKTGYTDKYIFLPASGYRYDSSLKSLGSTCYYWSRSLTTPLYSCKAHCIWFYLTNSINTRDEIRCYGYSVRPVRK